MLKETLKLLFARDLLKLRSELELYQDESDIWKIEKNISNSAGNLCLHLIGNLNMYVGREIGKIDYIRERDKEFTTKNVPREVLLAKIADTADRINRALTDLDENDLENDFPIVVFDKKTSIEYMLVHLTTHLSYHLGQVNYHRRLLG